MIPFIRSIAELMAITEPRGSMEKLSKKDKVYSSTLDSGQKKQYIRSKETKEIILPALPKTKRSKWINNKSAISRFIDDLDYNNQIQSSYDLTLLARHDNSNLQDVA